MELKAHIHEDGRIQTLNEHLYAVSHIAKENAAKIGLPSVGELIGLVHDLGKGSEAFQQYISMTDSEEQKRLKGSVDHSTAGAQLIWNNVTMSILRDLMAMCVASHHSGLIDGLRHDGTNYLLKRMRKSSFSGTLCKETATLSEIMSATQDVVDDAIQLINNPGLQQELLAVTAKIDLTTVSPTTKMFQYGLLVRFVLSCLIDADRLDTIDFVKPFLKGMRTHARPNWDLFASQIERTIDDFGSPTTTINALRFEVKNNCQAFAQRPKGVYTLTVPPGGAKTLSVASFAMKHAAYHKMDRVIYVAPYTSILDQNADVLRQILEPTGKTASVVLEHHCNLDPDNDTFKAKLLSDNWDALVICTTFVQVLNCLFDSGTRSLRRLHQMANSIIIFDEIQTMPVDYVHIFANAINFIKNVCGCTVILCTATQPLLHKVNHILGAVDVDGEIVPDVPSLFGKFDAVRRCDVIDNRKMPFWTMEEVVALVKDEMTKHSFNSALVVCNTKKEALTTYQLALATLPGVDVYHLSTSLCVAHRLTLIEEIKTKLTQGKKVVCVSTQLIEAGVDISFDCGVRMLCGLDSVYQTSGRINRNGIGQKGRLHIVNLEFTPPQLGIGAAQTACEFVLNKMTRPGAELDLSDPKMIELYFKKFFFERAADMSYNVHPNDRDNDPENDVPLMSADSLLRLGSTNGNAKRRAKEGGIFFAQSFQTASRKFQAIRQQQKVSLIVPYGDGQAIIDEIRGLTEMDFRLLRRSQRFTVDIFPFKDKTVEETFRALVDQGKAEEVYDNIYALLPKFYDSTFGFAGGED